MGLISKIYNSNKILFKSGSRKGKSKYEIGLAVEKGKMKQFQRPDYIAWLEKKIKEYKKKKKKRRKK